MLLALLVLLLIPIATDIPSLLLVYAIIWKSPRKLKFIRLFLLKMLVSKKKRYGSENRTLENKKIKLLDLWHDNYSSFSLGILA